MYKAIFVKAANGLTGTNRNIPLETQHNLADQLAYGTRVLGYDGICWALYHLNSDLFGKPLPGSREWIKVPREKFDPFQWGELIIQHFLDNEFLVMVQDVTEDEYDVQLALGTIIKGPLKICTLATCITSVRNKIHNA